MPLFIAAVLLGAAPCHPIAFRAPVFVCIDHRLKLSHFFYEDTRGPWAMRNVSRRWRTRGLDKPKRGLLMMKGSKWENTTSMNAERKCLKMKMRRAQRLFATKKKESMYDG